MPFYKCPLNFILRIGIYGLFMLSQPCSSQENISPIKEFPQVFIPNTQATHPFGVFISRIQHLHYSNVPRQKSFTLTISNGNIWLPKTIGNIPTNKEDKDAVAAFSWHERDGYFDFSTTPNTSLTFEADGVFRLYLPQLQLPINNNHFLTLSSRIVSFDSGKFPFSTFTNDNFIEWVHSNVAGGEDPFARKVNGLNNPASFYYSDRNEKTITMKGGEVVLSGFDINHYFFPSIPFLKTNNIDVSFSSQLGINISKINPGVDLGGIIGIGKTYKLKSGNQFELHASYGILKQKLASFGSGVEIMNKSFMHSGEFLSTYHFSLKNNQFFGISALIFAQSSYLNNDEDKHLVLTGEKESSFWHYGISHLYRYSAGVTLIASYTKNNMSYAVYFREDIPLNNAPDTQTGISVKMEW